MFFSNAATEIWILAGFQTPQLTSTNLPPDKQYWIKACSPVSGVTKLAGFVEGGELLIPFENLKDQEFSYTAMEQDGDPNLYMAMNTTLTEAAPQLQFQSATGGDIGDGDTGDGSLARIAGTVQIDGTPAARDVLVISNETGSRKVLAEAASEADGTFDITYPNWTGAVIALALDDYGQPFAPETTLNQGAIIHPTMPNGYVFEATTAGTTGTEEPAWNTGGNTQSGSVSFSARPYYRPIASGPLQADVLAQQPTEYPLWRLFMYEAANTARLHLNLLEFFDGGDNQIPTVGGEATAGPTSASLPAENAFDGNTSTRWLSDFEAIPNYLTYQFAEPVEVKRIKLHPNSASNDRMPVDFSLEYSSDGGETWSEAGRWQTTWPSTQPQDFVVE